MLLSRVPSKLPSSTFCLLPADFNSKTQNQTQARISRLLYWQKKKNYIFGISFIKNMNYQTSKLIAKKKKFSWVSIIERILCQLAKIKRTQSLSPGGTQCNEDTQSIPFLLFSFFLNASHSPLLFSPSSLPHRKTNVFVTSCLTSLEWLRRLIVHH